MLDWTAEILYGGSRHIERSTIRLVASSSGKVVLPQVCQQDFTTLLESRCVDRHLACGLE